MKTWTNFAGDQTCRPAAVARPTCQDELAAAIASAARSGRRVRVAGAGHSFTDAVLTDGTLIDLSGMNRVLDIDHESALVRCQAGISLGALNTTMWESGLAFANLGDIDVQSIAGATATGTHGTGHTLPNLSASLHSIELTLADGATIEVNAHNDPAAYRAARVSIGALGVVSAVTLQAVPAFTLHGVDTTMPFEKVLGELDDLIKANDHFGFFAFPHSDMVLTKTWNRTDAAPAPPSRASQWLHDVAITNYAYWGACLAGRAWPHLIPAINRACTRLAGTTRRTDRSYRIFATPRRVPLTEMEYAIPIEHAAEAVRLVRDVASRHKAPTPLEVRFVAPDDAYLSPAAGRQTCYIAVHQFKGLPWETFFREVEQIMLGFDGRPHWGKRHFRTADTLRPTYPDWDAFAAVRSRLDPAGLFTNNYVSRVLGPVPE
ncbi:oxidoreductase [Mycobacterium intermedium]|uniref:Oxidoreductase n=1 Tax=Mycobacterium intermedium TaxID=28445 RepID=A0A1E3S9P3_MYCIE|nr:D-arabinono-1,4-lactone oxidase [Mycobacterium intermedium]MCV6962708.1 FAD-binding protein [Mycobacterium intermedium]ODQ98878.1 oxidoreductase [Mycobacterium intermedium]OPE45561.1 oxidoreductase [Mycobacterium intermedium]ORA93529.1 oxidoreductase [Mycobacterium intermedium]